MQGYLRVQRYPLPPLEIVLFELDVDRIAQLPAADHRHMARGKQTSRPCSDWLHRDDHAPRPVRLKSGCRDVTLMP
jgi:hypothetical protein